MGPCPSKAWHIGCCGKRGQPGNSKCSGFQGCVYRGYIGIMDNKTEAAKAYCGYIGPKALGSEALWTVAVSMGS